MCAAGATLQQIGDEHGITRQRVEQLLPRSRADGREAGEPDAGEARGTNARERRWKREQARRRKEARDG
jgi:hypothetical protein